MKIKEELRGPLALVAVERTEDRELAAMVKLDLDEGGDARYGRIVRYDTYDADELLPAIGDRIVVTAGSDFPQELRMPNSIDILATLGEQTLVDACSRRGIPYAGPAGEEAIDDFRAIAALAKTIIAGEPA